MAGELSMCLDGLLLLGYSVMGAVEIYLGAFVYNIFILH